MGIVAEYLHDLIVKQVNDHGLVVWYDFERQYGDLVVSLAIPNTTIAIYEGSFFALRKRIEPLLEGLEPPRLVVYVPLDPAETHDAFAEIEVAGVTLKPGQQPPARNTRLSIIARNALKQVIGDEKAAGIEKQVEAGKLSLGDLDKLAEKGREIGKGVLTLIFGTSVPQEVALEFLSGEAHDSEIISKGAVAELAVLLRTEFKVNLPEDGDPKDFRPRLANHVLACDLAASLRGQLPDKLGALEKSPGMTTLDTCVAMARSWRLRRNLRESYVVQANRVEKELALAGMDFGLDQAAGSETFLAVERALQRRVESALLGKATPDMVELARKRQSSFWSEQLPDVQARWALIAVSGQVLLEADRVRQEVKPPVAGIDVIFNAYTEGDHPLCLLDTHYRHMERRYHNFDFEVGEQHKRLEQLVSVARQRYMEVGSSLASAFLRGYHAAEFHIAGILLQTEVFEKRVKPKLAEGKTAYVWVDALRYEMAMELARSLSEQFIVETEAALAAVPTITEIGMAALLPPARQEPSVFSVGEGKLALEIDGVIVKDRKDRVNFLKSHSGVEVFDAKLDDLLPNPRKKVREGIAAAQLILITSQEIDALCEGDNVPLARRTMDGMLHELRRAFRGLSDLGVETIVFTADHGYLFGEEIGVEMLIDSPGGETLDLHRRVWVGHGGMADPAYLRAKIADFGLGGDLEIATPWNFACFKVKGGAKAYFHGGLSPEELIIPVVTLTPNKGKVPLQSKAEWSITTGSAKITTRFCSVIVDAKSAELLELVPPKIRVELRVKGETISLPVSASYGFVEATGDVQLTLAEDDPKTIERNTITLMITKDFPPKTMVSIHLLDAGGTELAKRDNVEMSVSI